MRTLVEIEAATAALSTEQMQELLVFVAAKLRAQGGRMPDPRFFSKEQITAWIAQDESDLNRLREER